MLERLEAMASRVIEGWSARLFRVRLQPVQIAKRVIRAMEAHQTISLAKTFVPNSYVVSLSPTDYAEFAQYKRSLERDLAEAVLGAARVSRRHAEVRLRLGRYTLYDLQSTNGTFVNGRRIAEMVLSDEDRITIGGAELVVKLEG